MRAISLTEGRVLSILDAEGTCHRRIWCCLETHQVIAIRMRLRLIAIDCD